MIWDDAKIVAFDFETSGTLEEYALQPWRVATDEFWATSVSLIRWQVIDGMPKLAPDNSRLFFNFGRTTPERMSFEDISAHIRYLLEQAIMNDWWVVTWFGTFDISVCIAYGCGDLVHKVKWLDGMLLWRHLFIEPEYEMDRSKKKSYSLKAAVPEFMPVEHHGYEQDIQFHSTDPIALGNLQKYNDRDSVYTWVLAKIFWSELSEKQRRCALIEAECLSMVAEANLRGLPVDTLVTRELAAKLENDAKTLLEKLSPHGVTEKIVRSPTQLGKLLFDDWGLPVLKENTGKKTGRVSRATDKEVLHELAFVDERCRDLRSYREALNNRTKFAEAPLLSATYNADGHSRPAAIVFGTYSGRMTYASKQGKGVNERQTGFALHQEKRGKEFRSIIQAPAGYTLMEFDAAGQEFRWMAILANDPAMLQLCQPGEDAHSYMAARIVSMDYPELVALVKAEDKDAEQNRYLGKVANLCIAEGTTILTDRGPCNIEHVRPDDLVWDGVEFVRHSGVRFSGVFQVISYKGVTATLDHKVLLTNGRWEEIEAAQRMGWAIQSALGAGWACRSRSAIRIVGGLVRRAISTVRCALREGAVQVRSDQGGQLAHDGSRTLNGVQRLRNAEAASSPRPTGRRYSREEVAAKAGQRHAAAVSKPERPIVPQLRWARDRVSLLVDKDRRGAYSFRAAVGVLRRLGYRQDQQRWSLRAWKLALGYAQGEPCQSREVRTYDIVNCGPRTRFAANGLIVHNSLQYRTYPKTFRKVARVQYNIPMELPEAQRIHRTYQNTYTEVPRYWDRQIRLTKQLGYVETLGGRRVQVVGDWDGKFGWQMESTSLNYPVQGTGADQKYLAMQVIKPYLLSIGAYFAWDLHDGIYLWVPDDKVLAAAAHIKALLANLPYREAWGFTPPIPLPWDCKFGPGWGWLKEWKDG